jgi:hypothetical protein
LLQALNRTSNVPAMPKAWPQQSPRASKTVKFGPEREVMFLSEALGIKIEDGDIIREAAGVDIRRPITNIMWGDTVALIKMAPRPIILVVAKEMTGHVEER